MAARTKRRKTYTAAEKAQWALTRQVALAAPTVPTLRQHREAIARAATKAFWVRQPAIKAEKAAALALRAVPHLAAPRGRVDD